MDKISTTSNVKSERNYGIDLLRVLAMFFVIVLHNLGQGGLLENAKANSAQFKFAWFLEIIAYCAVNVFALISGYVSYRDEEKPVKYSNYIKIWFQVIFYGLLVTLIFNIVSPSLVTFKNYITVLFPVTNGLYWYLTAYTGLFIIMPFLNKAVRKCDNKTLKKLFVAIFLVFSLFDTITKRFILNKGYSFVWIVLLYILGAIIKKCEIGKNLKKYKIVIGILVLYVITYLYKIYGFKLTIMNVTINKNLLVAYTSPTILGASILYVLLFSKIKFGKISKSIIKFAAPSAFAIYLLNNHKLIWKHVIKGMFANIAKSSLLKIFIYVIGFACLFVIGSVLIDKVRQLLFKILHINSLAEKISEKLNKAVDKISNIL